MITCSWDGASTTVYREDVTTAFNQVNKVVLFPSKLSKIRATIQVYWSSCSLEFYDRENCIIILMEHFVVNFWHCQNMQLYIHNSSWFITVSIFGYILTLGLVTVR